MSVNQYAPNLGAVETAVNQQVIASTNLLYGGNAARPNFTRVTSKVAAWTKVAGSGFGQYMNMFVGGDASVSGGGVRVYAGEDDSATLVLDCPVGASSCRAPLTGGILFPDGYSIYLLGDGTNYVNCTYQTYSIAPTASTEITVGTDTHLRLVNPTTNYGALTILSWAHSSAAFYKRPMIQFDLSSIPAGSTIIQAVLQLKLSTISGDYPVTINPITKAWTASEATWTIAKTGDPWSVLGGDFEATPVWSGNINAARLGFFRPDITPLVQRWVDGSLANNGLIGLAPNVTGATSCNFTSFGFATAASRPKLYIQY